MQMFRFFSTSALSLLRKETSASILMCKEALVKNGDNFEAALKWLKEESQAKGLLKLEKAANRETSQGMISYAHDSNFVSLIKVCIA